MRSRGTLVIPAVRRARLLSRLALAAILLFLVAEAVFSTFLGPLGTTVFLLVIGWHAVRMLLDLHHLPLTACDELRQMELESREQMPVLWDMVEKYSAELEMPRPKVWIFGFVDCFAASWNCLREKAIAIDVVVLAKLPPEQVASLVGHELAHIKNRDQPVINVIQNGTLAVAYGGLSLYAAAALCFVLTARIDFAIAAGVCGFCSVAIFLAMKRVFFRIMWQQEFAADALGAAATGNPMASALALVVLEERKKIILAELRAQGLVIDDDEHDSDHPPTAERVRRLLLPH